MFVPTWVDNTTQQPLDSTSPELASCSKAGNPGSTYIRPSNHMHVLKVVALVLQNSDLASDLRVITRLACVSSRFGALAAVAGQVAVWQKTIGSWGRLRARCTDGVLVAVLADASFNQTFAAQCCVTTEGCGACCCLGLWAGCGTCGTMQPRQEVLGAFGWPHGCVQLLWHGDTCRAEQGSLGTQTAIGSRQSSIGNAGLH